MAQCTSNFFYLRAMTLKIALYVVFQYQVYKGTDVHVLNIVTISDFNYYSSISFVWQLKIQLCHSNSQKQESNSREEMVHSTEITLRNTSSIRNLPSLYLFGKALVRFTSRSDKFHVVYLHLCKPC